MAEPQRIFTIYCLFHLGDHLYNLNLFRQITQILRRANKKIHYYCPNQYHAQLIDFTPPADVFELCDMRDLDGDAIFDKGLAPGWFSPLLELHIKNEKLPKNIFNGSPYFDILYEEFYAQFLETWLSGSCGMCAHKSPYPVSFISPRNPDLDEQYEILPEKYKNLDILFINSRRSGGSVTAWDKYIITAAKSGAKVATTALVVRRSRSIPPCAAHETMKTIAAISTRAKCIIAIGDAAALSVCFNENTMEFVDCIYVCGGRKFKNEKILCFEKLEDICLTKPFLHAPKPIRKIAIETLY